MASPNGQHPRLVSFVLYPHLTVFDLVGPLQVISALAERRPEYQPVVVAADRRAVATDVGIPMVPNATFDEVPRPYVVVVPGGDIGTYRAMHDPAVRNYIRAAAQSAEIVMSVCTGAIILASLGLLRDRPATTHWAFHSTLAQFGASYRRKRWVETGKFLCTAGVSAGIDGALELAARLTDVTTARQIQFDLQYDPQLPFGPIDWQMISINGRVTRALFSAAAPLIALRAKRLMSQGK